MTVVLQSEYLVGLLMRTCWAHEQVVSWTQLWGVCKLWCDVWLENDQAWVTYFLNRQNSRISWGLQREHQQDALIVRLRHNMLVVKKLNDELCETVEKANNTLGQSVWALKEKVRDVDRLRRQVEKLEEKNDKQKVKLDEAKVSLEDANKTVWELRAKIRKRDIEDSRVVGERLLKPGRPALVAGAQ